MKLSIKALAIGAGLLGAGVVAAVAGGSWQTLPGIGSASYCASTVTGTGNLGGATGQGQGTIGSICGQTIPAGPATFAGTEIIPADIYTPGTNTGAGGPQTAFISLPQLGQGAMVDLTTVVSSTIPANTPFYFLDGTQASAFTITMPASPIEGQIQRVTCEAATAGVLTVAANTSVNASQTLNGNPNAACVASTNYNWRYQASNSTWYRY